jgi:hypothetical protein
MLISSPIFSQNDTVKLPFEIAKKIALDLEEKDRLQSVQKVNTLIIANLKEQNSTLSLQSENKSTQLVLLRDSYNILKTQLEAEKAKKPGSNWLVWALATLAAFGGGFVLGVVN